MFTVSDLKETKVYQKALDEGRDEGKQSLVLRLLERGFGAILKRQLESVPSHWSKLKPLVKLC